MDKIGQFGDIIWDNAIYLIVLVLFFMGMFVFLQQQTNGAGVWEDFYAKEIAKTVNLAKPGDEIKLDVQKATIVAKKSKVDSFNHLFEFDNVNSKVCISLNRGGRKTCYSYYNNVDIIDYKIDLGASESGGNLLEFKVIEKQKEVKNG